MKILIESLTLNKLAYLQEHFLENSVKVQCWSFRVEIENPNNYMKPLFLNFMAGDTFLLKL